MGLTPGVSGRGEDTGRRDMFFLDAGGGDLGNGDPKTGKEKAEAGVGGSPQWAQPPQQSGGNVFCLSI